MSPRRLALCTWLALACTPPPGPAGRPPPADLVTLADDPQGSAAPAGAPVPAAPVNASTPTPPGAPGPAARPANASTTAPARPCAPGERLDSGCTCRTGGACFDICCGEDARCAHPTKPGGPSACFLAPLPPPAARPARPCTDGEALAGCRCDGTVCMDLCCVGSTCSHHSSPDGNWAKCVTLPGRR